MEYCPYGQLFEVVKGGKEVTPALLVDWSRQIADGMHYLHLHKIIHRDLKSPKLVLKNQLLISVLHVTFLMRFQLW